MQKPRPSEVFDFPQKDDNGDPMGQVRIMTLRMEQHDEAKRKAHEKLKKKNFTNEDLASPAIEALYGDAIAKEVLAMCVCRVDGVENPDKGTVYGPIFRDADDVAMLSPSEVLVLFSAYQLVQHKYGPMEKMDSDDVEAWIKRLGVGGSGFPLLLLPLPDLVELTTSLAAKIYGVYETLASQRLSLPDTLVSSLEIYLTDIGSFGDPASSPDPTGGDSKPEITIDDAARYAAELRD